MENASKALIIAGAILISILIIAIGMFIYNNSIGSVEGALSSMDTQEIEAANKAWTNYEGKQKGSQVKSLINKLIANADTYQEEEVKVIEFSCQPRNNTTTNNVDFTSGNLNGFINTLNGLYNQVQAKHTYTVSLDYGGTPLIRRIIVTYN